MESPYKQLLNYISFEKIPFNVIFPIIIDNDLDVNTVKDKHNKRLIEVYNGIEHIEQLLPYGLDIDTRFNYKDTSGEISYDEYDYFSITLLMLGCLLPDNMPLFKLMLENGASLDMQDDNGDTALIHLLYGGCDETIELIKILLDNGASISIKNNDGRTALDIAKNECYDTYDDIIELLSKYV